MGCVVLCGVWCAVCGVWGGLLGVVCGVWCVVCGVWCLVSAWWVGECVAGCWALESMFSGLSMLPYEDRKRIFLAFGS